MITIVDYGIGNLGSVANTLDRLGYAYGISDNPHVLESSDALILPGVGAAGEGMENLRKKKLTDTIINCISRGKPFLGICLGMQLLFEKSEEGDVQCLKVLKGPVVRYQKERKVPQIGWNRVQFSISNFQFSKMTKKLFEGIEDDSYFYFVNSYYCDPSDKEIIVGTTEYGEEFASVVIKKNIVATQFHPEKSGKEGFQLLKNWCDYYVD